MASQNMRTGPLDAEELVIMYLTAKEQVIEAGYADEIDWQEEVSLESLNERTFIREAAWVVLSAGFKEAILRCLFGEISKAFLYWGSAKAIVSQAETCRNNALDIFGHRKKIDAILEIVRHVAVEGMPAVRCEIKRRGIAYLREFPFIGPVTACHLAKNIGITIVKPDRHLNRIAAKTGYSSASEMCRVISEFVGDSLSVIDIVMWRHATLRMKT